MRYFTFLLLIYLSVGVLSPVSASYYDTSKGKFSGWVSKVNNRAKLIRFKIEFNNFKYMNKRDVVEIWNTSGSSNRCKGYIVGKSSIHMLVKIKDFTECMKYVYLAPGSFVQFFSQDLVNNLKMGGELNKILLKKHLALQSKLANYQRLLDGHLDKMNAVNGRYDVLRQKLENEWRVEVGALEEDRLNVLNDYEHIKSRLQDVDFKMERYNINDDNFSIDRWSLDPRQYIKN